MERARPDPEDERAQFEHAIAQLDALAGEEVLREKSGSAARPAAPARRSVRLERRLRSGPEIAERIDLHGCDRAAARERLEAFLRAVTRRSPAPELVLVIHGKGARVLARAVRELLDADPRVAEHVSAPRRLGGEGARVARLRAASRGR